MSADRLSGIVIRRCIPADAAALSEIACRTFYDTFTGTCSAEDMTVFLDTFYSESQMAKELGDPADKIFFAENNGVPLGYIRFFENDPDFPHDSGLKSLELNRLYIDTAQKGSGLAQALMNFYLEYAREHDYHLLWLGVWEHNYRAQAFYRKYGFSFTGHRHPFPIGNTPQTDEWWAWKVNRQNF